MHCFFDKNYQTPVWFEKKFSRRSLLKSAAGASAMVTIPTFANTSVDDLTKIISSEPWLTLDAVLAHLLPSSPSGPGAKEIQATNYLYQVVTYQPVSAEEKSFIVQGVQWLNSYSQGQTKQDFVKLNHTQKEQMLRAIANSSAGENWLNTLLNYIFEAMLSPPAYGGNPNGIGWQWLEHQAGFPLPPQGKRYYEIPGTYQVSVKNLPVEDKVKS